MAKKLSEIDLWISLVDTQVTSGSFLHTIIGGDSYRINIETLRALVNTTSKYTAHAGGGQADATELVASENLVHTVASSLDSVKVIDATVNTRQTVRNEGANTLNIYPQSGDNFVGLAADMPIPLAVGASITFVCFTDGEYQY
jgi:hypothetical protein